MNIHIPLALIRATIVLVILFWLSIGFWWQPWLNLTEVGHLGCILSGFTWIVVSVAASILILISVAIISDIVHWVIHG